MKRLGFTGHIAIHPPIFLLLLMFLININAVEGSGNDLQLTVESVGSMVQARYNHTSTPLSNSDELLVTGGTSDGYGSMSSAEIFDEGTNSWRSVSEMEIPRMRHTADEIEPGVVMVMGGFLGGIPGAHPSLIAHYSDTGSSSFESTEIYDSEMDRWSSGPDMLTGRFWHATAELSNGDILIIGGLNVTSGALAECEIFDISSGRFVNASPMGQPRVRFTVDVLMDGSILVSGGHDGSAKIPVSSCEIYIPDEDRWIPASSMNRARGYHSSSILRDGRVLVSGGFSSPGKPDWNDSEIYDPDADEWTPQGTMMSPRHNHVTIPIKEGMVLIIGGSNCDTGMCHSGMELFDPATGKWEDTRLLIIGRKWCNADVLPSGNVLVSGGKACNYPEVSTDLLKMNHPGVDRGSKVSRNDGDFYLLAILLAISFITVNLIIKSHITRS